MKIQLRPNLSKIKRHFNLIGFLFILVVFLVLPNNALAATIFQDQFNGSGELSSYNSAYNHLVGLFGSTGNATMDVVSDRLILDTSVPEDTSAYLYTEQQSINNRCASIDFKQDGNLGTHNTWTKLLLHFTPDGTQREEIHIESGVRWYFFRSTGPTLTGSIAYDSFIYHTLKGCISGTTVTAYLDNAQLFQAQSNASVPGYFGFGAEYPVNLDNFRITNFTPSLNVPLLKQTAEPWQGQVYDSANLWNPSNPTINRWGCAITSAAMVFQYHGIKKLPDGIMLDPGTLNKWLKIQKDGYVGNGLLNWLALSRLSKQAKSINGLSFNALEYARTNGFAQNKLTEALNSDKPGILGEPGHFVVGKGIITSGFEINDPYYSRNNLEEYGNTFNNLGVYSPSNTDLSYIMLTVNKGIDVRLLDSGGNSAGNVIIEGPIVNPEKSEENSGELKILYLQKPLPDNYQIVITSNGDSEYKLTIYLYDKNGDVFTRSENGTLSPELNKIIPLTFNGQNDIYIKKVTYLSTFLDIEKFYKQKLILSKNIKRDLDESLAKAFLDKILKNNERQLMNLLEFEDILNENKGTKILLPAFETLLYDVNYLSTHL